MYAIVQDNEITRYVKSLPDVIRIPSNSDPSGFVQKNSKSCSKNELVLAGYYEIRYSTPSYNPITHDVTGETIEIEDDHVSITKNVTQKDLSKIKEDAWKEVKFWREQRFGDPFTYANTVFDADQLSREKILSVYAAALTAKITNSPFSELFTAKDNTRITLNSNTALEFGLTLYNRVGNLHDASQTARANINDSNSANAIMNEIYTFKSNYPEYE